MSAEITPKQVVRLRKMVEVGGRSNAWRRSDYLAVLDALESSRAEVQRLTEQVERFKTGAVRVSLDGKVYFEPYVQLLREEIDHLRAELARLQAGAVVVPELTAEDMEQVTGREYFNGFRSGYNLAKSRTRLVPAPPQPSADVVVVPREEWEVIDEILKVSEICANEGGTDRKCCTQTDDHHIPLTRLRALRSSTNHDAQDAGERR